MAAQIRGARFERKHRDAPASKPWQCGAKLLRKGKTMNAETKTPETMTDDDRWAAVLRRDRALDGRFVTGVLTTGIYCRPSCAARHPARGNVRFFEGGTAARAAGLRPCKRCLPDDVARDAGAVLAAIAAIKASEEPLALADLATRTGYSPTHFQRVFTRHTGLSPAAYARALREERARQALSEGGRVTDAIYDAGFSGPSRFYGHMEGRMGMTASAWVNGGKGATIHWAVVPTSLGDMLVAATAKGVCRLSFDEGREALEDRFPAAELVEGGADFAALLKEVVDAVETPVDPGQALFHRRHANFQVAHVLGQAVDLLIDPPEVDQDQAVRMVAHQALPVSFGSFCPAPARGVP